MVLREDFDQILPDEAIKRLAQRKFLLVGSIVGIIALIIIIVLAALLGHCGKPTTPPQPKEECRTPPRIHSAAWISDNMDTSINPCENFYKFSCGGWEKRNSIPPDHFQLKIFDHLDDEIEEKLREIIEHIPQRTWGSSSPDSLAAAEGKLQLFFRSCVNDYGRMKASGGILVNKIKAAFKGWYVLNPANWSRDFDVNEAIAATHADFITNVFFRVYPSWNSNIKRYILTIRPFTRWYYVNPNSSEEIAFRQYIRDIGGLLLDDSNVTVNSSEKESRVEQFVDDAYRMEADLYEMYNLMRRNGSYFNPNITTVRQLQSTFPQLNWGVILTRMYDGLGVNNDTLIQLSSPFYFLLLNDLILNETQMHIRDRIFNNYMVWEIAYNYAEELSWKYREARNKYEEAVDWYRERPPTWKTCLDTVNNNLGTLLKYEFIKNHLSPEKKDEVKRIYMDISQALDDSLKQLDWIDQETKTKVKDKLESVIPKVGFSDIYYNQTLMAQLHSSLNITPTATYFENLLSLNKFQRKRYTVYWLKLYDDSDQDDFEGEPDGVGWIGAWIMPYLQRYGGSYLRVPPGAMLEPLYNSDRPGVVNYGVLGSLVAGQLMRLFDQYGRRIYLKNGSYVNWWTSNMTRANRKNIDCFKQYFQDIEVGPYLVNGENETVTISLQYDYQIDRLMTEFGGIRAAYNGYKKWLKDTGSKEPVPAGLDLTRDQLFFVSSVQTKCYLRTDEESYYYASRNRIPEDAEVNTLLSRMSEFSGAFNCPEGSKMRKESPCKTF